MANPPIPVHFMCSVEFDAARLKTDNGVVVGVFAGENIKVKRIGLDGLILFEKESYSDLYDVELLNYRSHLGKILLTFRYFS